MHIPNPSLKPQTKNIVHRYNYTKTINKNDYALGCFIVCKLNDGKRNVSEGRTNKRQNRSEGSQSKP